MAIKKGKRTLEYERQWNEFIERQRKEKHEVHCPVHGWMFIRKDLEPECPSCSPLKGDKNE